MPTLRNILFKYQASFILFIVALLSVANVFNGRNRNYHIFCYGSEFFWQGTNPYTEWNVPLDVFVYGPLFSILFTPFAYLPPLLGNVLWNVLGVWFLVSMIYRLPYLDKAKQHKLLWLVCLLILQSVVESQYNIYVAAFFLAGFLLLEKQLYFWAIVVMCVSGYTKVYGFFELMLLLWYPNKLKNALYTLGVCVFLFFLPLVKIPLGDLVDYYRSWVAAVQHRHGELSGTSILNLFKQIYLGVLKYKMVVQVLSLGVLLLGVLLRYRCYHLPKYKVQGLGLLMIWSILFSNAAEPHTYVIAITGLCYVLMMFPSLGKLKTIYLGVVFFFFCIVPIDVLFPVSWSLAIYAYGINSAVLLVGWLAILYDNLSRPNALPRTS